MQRTKTPTNPFGMPNIVIPAEALFNEKLTWREKALFGILLNLSYNEKGYCWASNNYLSRIIDARPDTVSTMIGKLQKERYIKLDYETVRGEVIGTKHVRKITVDPEYPKHHAKTLKNAFGKIQRGVWNNPKGPLEQSKRPFGTIQSNIDSDINSDIDSSTTSSVKPITPKMFDKFWELYPRKINKGAAKTKWESICNKPRNERPTWEQIEQALTSQKKTKQWQELKFIPHPTTWLNQQRWLDDPDEIDKNHDLINDSSKPSQGSNEDPYKVIEKELQSKDLAKPFTKNCYEPAKHLFNGVNQAELAYSLADLFFELRKKQDKNLPKELRKLLPGPLSLMQSYIDWIEKNDWIKDKSLNLLSTDHKLFAKFLREEASKDNMERDPLTGRSYMKG